MGKLIYRHGTMGSSKSAELLMWRYNYEEKGFKTLLCKPEIDTREERNVVRSRIGLEHECHLIKENELLSNLINTSKIDVLFVDEAQFLSEEQVEDLQELSLKIDVICFGLKTDFRRKLFPGSKALLELADSIEEIKSVCQCGRKAIINARFDEFGEIVTEGEQIDIGGNEKYEGICKYCYKELVEKKNKKIG